MSEFNPGELKSLYMPPPTSHKGQNGKLLIIGGSKLFHAASLWSLKVASRIVDMVFYSSVPENNEIVRKLKEEFRDGIVVPRSELEEYVREADCILIGPGMVRTDVSSIKYKVLSIKEINELEDEGEQTYFLTKYLLDKYPKKQWIIDAGALQMMDASWLKQLQHPAIVTPHHKEFEGLFGVRGDKESVGEMGKKYNCVILLKGPVDIVSNGKETIEIEGGNAGMTKGGTGDVLAGLVAALACKNDPFLAAKAGSFINKKAGESLFEKVGLNFNASDLCDEIPKVMEELL